MTMMMISIIVIIIIIIIIGHFSALARLINLLRRAGKLDECSNYLEQVGFSICDTAGFWASVKNNPAKRTLITWQKLKK